MFEFRKAVADWYMRRFGVELNPATEVVTLIGSKEGIAHMPWAYLDEGDIALIPSPGYPVYKVTTLLAGGTPYMMPLREENGFMPVYEQIPKDVRDKAKILFINYPNNPTGAHATDELYEKTISEASKHNILVCHDAAYSEVTFDGYQATGILQFDRDKRYSVEFISLEDVLHDRLANRLAVGNADAIQNLGRLKTNIDSGVFQAIQIAGIEALTGSQDCVENMRTVYARRRDLVVDGLSSIGIRVRKPSVPSTSGPGSLPGIAPPISARS
jgi:LL-diaminopimelate aminotransferase